MIVHLNSIQKKKILWNRERQPWYMLRNSRNKLREQRSYSQTPESDVQYT